MKENPSLPWLLRALLWLIHKSGAPVIVRCSACGMDTAIENATSGNHHQGIHPELEASGYSLVSVGHVKVSPKWGGTD